MGHHIPLSSPRYTYIVSQHSPCKLLCVAILLFTDPCQPTAHKTLATIMPQIQIYSIGASSLCLLTALGSSTMPGTQQTFRQCFQIKLNDCRILESARTVESCQTEQKKMEEAHRKRQCRIVPSYFQYSSSFPALQQIWEEVFSQKLLLSPRAGQIWSVF